VDYKRTPTMRSLTASIQKVNICHGVASYRLLIEDGDTDLAVGRFTFESLTDAIMNAREIYRMLTALNQEFFVVDLSDWNYELRC
jgi:hypothetical protein